MNGLDLKAEAVRAGQPLYRVAGEVRINPSQLSRLMNNRADLDDDTAGRIMAAIRRLAEPATDDPASDLGQSEARSFKLG